MVPAGSGLSFESDAIRWFSHERRRRGARRAKWGAIAAYMASVGGASFVPGLGWVALISALSALVAWLVEMASGPRGLTEGDSDHGTITVTENQLTVTARGETLTLDPNSVSAGWVEEPDHVVLELRDGRALSIRAEDAKKRQELLRALGVSAADRVLRVPIYSRLGSIPTGELFAAVASVICFPLTAIAWTSLSTVTWEILRGNVSAGSFAALVLVLLAMAVTTLPSAALLLAFRRRQAVVGTDGIAIEGAWRRVIPFSEIVDVRLEDWGAALTLEEGKTVRLATGRTDALYPTPATDEQKARARRLVERAKEALAEAGQSRGLDQKASWLASDERTPEAWRSHLEALGERVGDYRRPGISTEELLDIAKDPARTREQRAAAMFLIGKRRADVAAARLAVDACADPELAEVLGAALDGRLDRQAMKPSPAARVRIAVADEAQNDLVEDDAAEAEESRFARADVEEPDRARAEQRRR